MKRNLALFGRKLICRNVSHQIDVQNGTVQTSVSFEPEASGPDGIQGNYPVGYPAPALRPPTQAGRCGSVWVVSAAAELAITTLDKMQLTSNGANYSIVSFRDTSDSNKGKVSAALMNPLPEIGTEAEFEAGSIGATGGSSLSANPDDDTETLLVWSLGPGNQQHAAIVGRLSLVLTVNTAADFGTAVNNQVLSDAVMLSDTDAFVSVRDLTTARAVGTALTISGTTITPGAPANIGDATIIQVPLMSRLDSTRALVLLSTGAAWSLGVVTVDTVGGWSLGTTSAVSPLTGDGVMTLLSADVTLYAENARWLIIQTSGAAISSVVTISRTATTNTPSGVMAFSFEQFFEVYDNTTDLVLTSNLIIAGNAVSSLGTGAIARAAGEGPLAVVNDTTIGTFALVDSGNTGVVYLLKLQC